MEVVQPAMLSVSLHCHTAAPRIVSAAQSLSSAYSNGRFIADADADSDGWQLMTSGSSMAISGTEIGGTYHIKGLIFEAYFSGNISTKYGQTYGTFTYLHLLDPEISIEVSTRIPWVF